MNKLLKKIKLRLEKDSFTVFLYRILFFLFRIFFSLIDWIKYKLFSLDKTKTIKSINGSKMLLNLSDSGIAKDLFLAGVREPRHTELIKKIIKPGDIIFDIGANIGYYALLESRLVGNQGRVYAIEPVPDNIKNLAKNIELNQYKNIKIFELAFGDKNKQNYINLSNKCNWCSMKGSQEIPQTYQGKILVSETTFDNFIQENKLEYPDLVRMDVEGYEVEIINGMENFLNSSHPLKLIIELHCCFLDDLGFGLLKKLESRGFKIKKFFRDRSSLMLKRNKISRKIYYFLGKKIGGVYEFELNDITVNDLIKLKDLLKEETFHVYLARN